MSRHAFLPVAVVAVAMSACTETPQPTGGTATACTFPSNQAADELSVTCTLSGELPNLRLDPLSADAQCGVNSWTVSGQTVDAPMTVIFGQNGDDSANQVRIGVTVGPGTHGGNLAKDNPRDGCVATVGPSFPISTTFSGSHVAFVNKRQSPMCVFESGLTLSSFNQTLGVGVPVDITAVTRKGTDESLHERIDLEVARAVNGLLNRSALPLPDEVVSRSGRCADGWQRFTGT